MDYALKMALTQIDKKLDTILSKLENTLIAQAGEILSDEGQQGVLFPIEETTHRYTCIKCGSDMLYKYIEDTRGTGIISKKITYVCARCDHKSEE